MQAEYPPRCRVSSRRGHALFLGTSAALGFRNLAAPLFGQPSRRSDDGGFWVGGRGGGFSAARAAPGAREQAPGGVRARGDTVDPAHRSTLPSVWETLPQIVVVGGQSSGRELGARGDRREGLPPRGAGICTRRPLVLQLHATSPAPEAEGFPLPRRVGGVKTLVVLRVSEETPRSVPAQADAVFDDFSKVRDRSRRRSCAPSARARRSRASRSCCRFKRPRAEPHPGGHAGPHEGGHRGPTASIVR